MVPEVTCDWSDFKLAFSKELCDGMTASHLALLFHTQWALCWK